MRIEDLSPEAMAQITSYLCGTASIFLFLTGSVRLRQLLTLRGGITHMDLLDRSTTSTSRWPMFLSSLTGLRVLQLNRGFGRLGDFNVVWRELTKLSLLRVLHFRSVSTVLTPDISSNLDHLNSFGYIFPHLAQLSFITSFTTAVMRSLPHSICKLELSAAKGYIPIRQSLTDLASLPPMTPISSGHSSTSAMDVSQARLFSSEYSENLPFLRSLDIFDIVKLGKGHPLLLQLQKLPLTELAVWLTADVGHLLPPTLTKLKLHSHSACDISNLPHHQLEHLTLSGSATNLRKLRPFRKLHFLHLVGRLVVFEDASGVYYFPENLRQLVMDDQRIRHFPKVILPENLTFLECPLSKWQCIETEVSNQHYHEVESEDSAPLMETRPGFPAALVSLLDSESAPTQQRGGDDYVLPITLTALDYRYLNESELDRLAPSLTRLKMDHCTGWPILTPRLAHLSKLVLKHVVGVPGDFFKNCPKHLKQLCLHAVSANIQEESFEYLPKSIQKLDLYIEMEEQPAGQLTTKGLHFLSLLPHLKSLCLPHDMNTIEDANLQVLPSSLRKLRLHGECPLLTTGCFWYLPRFLKTLDLRKLEIGTDEDTVHLPRTLTELTLPRLVFLTPACGPLLPATLSRDLVNAKVPLNCQSLIKNNRGNLNDDSKLQAMSSLNFALRLPKSPELTNRPHPSKLRQEYEKFVFFFKTLFGGFLSSLFHKVEPFSQNSLQRTHVLTNFNAAY